MIPRRSQRLIKLLIPCIGHTSKDNRGKFASFYVTYITPTEKLSIRFDTLMYRKVQLQLTEQKPVLLSGNVYMLKHFDIR